MQTRILTAIAAGALICATADTASALSMKECSAKYKEAQTAGTLSGMKWNDFRKAQCGTDAASAPASPSVAPATKPTASAPSTRTAAPAAPSVPAATGPAVYPTGVSPKYSGESAGKARMHTCLDQYNANKATNGNGGQKWIAKGGGFYSECNKRLKG